MMANEVEKKVIESESLFRAVFDSIPDAIIVSDTQRRIITVNKGAEKLFGYNEEELIGKKTSKLYKSINDYEKQGQIWFNPKGNENRGPYRIVYKRKNGQLFNSETTGTVIKGPDHKINRLVGLVRDITDKEHLEEQLRRSQKLQAVGQLTGGIAHDFNNILAIIQGNLQLLDKMKFRNEKVYPRIEQALQGTKRGSDITSKLLNFSREENQNIQTISVNQLFWDNMELLTRTITSAISIKTNFAHDLWDIEVNPGDLEDAILNIVINARDAMPDGGELTITSRTLKIT